MPMDYLKEREYDAWARKQTEGIDVTFVWLISLIVALLGLIKFLSNLPAWAIGTIYVTIGLATLYFTVKLCLRLVRAFAAQPIRTSAIVAVAAGMLAWSFTYIRTMHSHSFPQSFSEVRPGQLGSTVTRIDEGGVTLYQLFAVPNAWSAPVVIPASFINVQLRVQFPQLLMSRNGLEISPQGYAPQAGDALRFLSMSNAPVGITLRVFSRTPRDFELRSPIPLPVLKAVRRG